jgi:hypothetical protein
MAIMIPVSIGELYDKLTILDIKLDNIMDEKKKQIVTKEYKLLNAIFEDLEWRSSFFNALRDINESLWGLEDNIRKCDKENDFSLKFIDIARNIYKYNDIRSKLKLEINKFYSSDIEEVKSYAV